MLTVRINEEPVTLPEDATVVDAVAATTGRSLNPDGTPADGGRLGVAVALHAAVVPRSRWSATPLTGGEDLEIVTAVQGG
ncbi:thiamine biosynthesis protein ThiS [Nesterenkonia sp. AN1]|uniref:sulfur carrier protein ThiS n=1 Tax=Nesterenkonia sp. AN1 TaxID=652017 RepID=UPI00044DCD69|nr:sulfur carrier protein ThiS [Nesterenkonia sp. AN1]EXF24771.1 thiamine biosynthesis protein ThiS [Nesterenkonia sp. AN1]